jgi:hypothetical protein
MAQICYAWDNAVYAWNQIELTWREFCVIQRLIGGQKTIYAKKRHPKKPELSEEEREILIGLLVRIKNEDFDFSEEFLKNKKIDISINVDDVEMTIEDPKEIKIKIRL